MNGLRHPSWQEVTVRLLTEGEIPDERAADLAIYVWAALRGAIMLSRTAPDTRAPKVTADLIADTLAREFR